jgi:biotin carboxylase
LAHAACPPSPRRRLAFAYHPFSFHTTDVARAADGVCELIWVVDTTMPDVVLMTELLRRLGTVVDVAGLSLDAAAERIAACSPDGILALADSLLLWTAQIAERLALPFHTPEVARRLTDKLHQRGALALAGLAGPDFWAVPAGSERDAWEELAAELRFPAMLKPREGEGSRDVVAVHSLEELRAQAERLSADHPSGLLVEEYLEDRPADEHAELAGYVSVESIVSAGDVRHLAITGRMPPVEPFRESGFFIPAALSGEERLAVLALASEAIAALGVRTGGLHSEIKLTPGGPRVIELNGRVGGGTPAMLLASTGIDLLPITMRLALGEHVTVAEMPATSGVVFVLYRHAPPAMRRIVAVEGLERVREQEGVEHVMLNRGPGQAVDSREGSWGHVFSVHGRLADHEQLKALARRIATETTVVGE